MRSSLLALALAAVGCTPDICARTSDCSSGQVCSVTGLCAIPADASIDGHADDAGATATGDAPADAPDDADPMDPMVSRDAPHRPIRSSGGEGP